MDSQRIDDKCKVYSDAFDLSSSIKNYKCPSFMLWNSLSRWSRQRVVNSTIINSEKIKKLASLTSVKLNRDPSILKEFTIPLAICQMSKMLLDEFYSYQNIEISISELVKSSRNSSGLNQ
ncbi:hypothetical protein T07_11731 [Trichinella nelsoni]|uniref:Uncharacterized protein n=1 Tax=Trichinella nelsoni TaxID=6336 RepID=A0A0V0SAF1_9BILA|nr:hypothetical protein T07_11731 [Trichinella nelsoni]